MTTAPQATTPAVPDAPPPSTDDEWGIDALDLEAYLALIGQEEPATASAEGLRALHEAHVRTVPFDNIDVILGNTPNLDLKSLNTKLVHRRRGGYCYEHALLFAAALERLGYPVLRCLARVNPDLPGTQTHMMLVVHTDDADYLADVGFGSGVLRPMPLQEGTETDQAGWPHRLTRNGRWWRLEQHIDSGWRVLHAFDDTPQRPVDYEVSNHYTATHPNSPFTSRVVVMRLDEGICRRLIGHELHVTYADGRDTERTHIPTERLDTTLRSLGITLEPDDLDRLRAQYD